MTWESALGQALTSALLCVCPCPCMVQDHVHPPVFNQSIRISEVTQGTWFLQKPLTHKCFAVPLTWSCCWAPLASPLMLLTHNQICSLHPTHGRVSGQAEAAWDPPQPPDECRERMGREGQQHGLKGQARAAGQQLQGRQSSLWH